MPTAYSYLRFSSPEQARGDSVRRQTAGASDWCRRHKVTLDATLSLRDEGVSAYRGKHRENPDTHGLAAFLHAVKSGRVQPGSYLIVESLDRLSREKIRPALTLLLNLIESEVKVVQLIPSEVVYDEEVDPTTLMMAVMELNRGHSESAAKSARGAAAWVTKRKNAGERLLTLKLPCWITHRDGKLSLVPHAAVIVRRIFEMSIAGDGGDVIARRLLDENMPTLGRTTFKGRPVRWTAMIVRNILLSRATCGEYQPHKGKGKTRTPVGDPVPDYYPAAIDRDTYLRAEAARAMRNQTGRGRRGRHVNLFGGLLRDCRTGGSFTYAHRKGHASVIVPIGTAAGNWSSFRAPAFDRALLSQLREIPSSEIHGDNEAARRVELLSARKAELERMQTVWRAKMDNIAIIDIVTVKLSEYATELAKITAELSEAQQEAASPLRDAWRDFRSLAHALDHDHSDETRARVRAAIRRSIDRILCVFRRGSDRAGIIQIWFRDGMHRTYIMMTSRTELRAKSVTGPTAAVDLRTPMGASQAVHFIEKVNLEELKEKLPIIATPPRTKAD